MSETATIGATVTVADLESDPYPIYARLREDEPVSWVESVGLWLVTRWDDVHTVDRTPEVFTGETEPSTLRRTFGNNLLASEGEYHDRIKSIIAPWFRRGMKAMTIAPSSRAASTVWTRWFATGESM